MGWARIDCPRAHYAQDTGHAIVLKTFRIVTGRGTCASEDAGFCCARGSRYRNPPGGDHFERNGLRPALLTALSYQFFHHVQSAADVTSQFMPTPLPGRGFGFLQTTFSPVIQPLSLRPGVPENLNSGLSDLLSMGSIVRNGLEALSPLSHLCVISITQSMGLAETERRTSSPVRRAGTPAAPRSLRDRAIGDLEALVDNRERFPQLLLVDAQRRIGVEGVPAD